MSRKHRKISEYREHMRETKESWRLFKEDVHVNVQNSTFKNRVIALLKLFVLIFIMIGLPIILFLMFRNTLFNKDYLLNIPNKLEDFKTFAFIPLIILQIVQIIVCFIPGQPIQFASSYLYGILGGYLISIIGALIGSTITYFLARFLGNESLHLIFGEQKVSSYVRKLNSKRSYMLIFLIYLIPGIPKDFVSYVAGVSNIRLRPFLVLSTLGRTPGIIESLLFGAFLADKNYIGLVIVVAVSLSILWFCITRREAIMNLIGSYEDTNDDN